MYIVLRRLAENVAGYGEMMAGASIGLAWRETRDKEDEDGLRRTRMTRGVRPRVPG